MTQETVFITGATGYIAKHIIFQLLEKGYKVVGQVRSNEKGENLVKQFNNSNFQYEVVEILEKDGAFDEVLSKHPEVTVFLHTASPAIVVTKDNEKDILIPAVKGTKNVLQSIKKSAPQIKKVIITSSVAATISNADLTNPNFSGGENTWNPETYEEAIKGDGGNAYRASKALAEKAAWEFVEKEKPNFKLSTILPSYTFGPQVFESDIENLHGTAKLLADLLYLKKDSPIQPFFGVSGDVRDVAKAHILAFEKEEAEGKRFVISVNTFNFQWVIDIFRKNFKDLAETLPVGTPLPENFFAHALKVNDQNARKILNIDYIPFEKTVVDHIKQIIDHKN
ncbi:NADPH-dependent cinnamyl-alcohol dehydrogenase [Scheffersomyces amazonensis]|uniref:NADPH-dependent cinnamyl-alcohol dehydrogenase n=1 Tax=Scheffersomyces amazonensis TaxID=1078765 RepID=UPI00315D2200